ncbi:MAG: class I SAM-dependent methyltransferase [Candidatus Abyssobacteria bacterium SURF_17]|uniref:Class I SAM-dependent methyltransferase n=1 Tax=Candidatus Abyssobacteria bacterium SURF_17 TaxID=2093361 RepID=A0A419EY10_9BACT|nr:MAG: class I SAM-dependent methyltransferase [Candidatus Abyssubacteria bacterium SURF_17]
MAYLFGDSDVAAHRLKVLADVYEKSTREFVAGAVGESPSLFVDLGCGPGYTTHALADVLQCARAVGLDNSEHFISLAQKTQTHRISFLLHDVTCIPFPTAPGDTLYCRFLLTHLRDPQALTRRWATQLSPKGLLLIEEVEQIHTTNRTFRAYLDIVESMLEDQSRKLYVGPIVSCLEVPGLLKRRTNKVKRLEVCTHKAAEMFFLNIQSWKHQPFVRTNYSSELINGLTTELEQLAVKSDDKSDIEWGLRQIAFERA